MCGLCGRWPARVTLPAARSCGSRRGAGTSGYWRAWFVTLGDAGLRVQLVTAAQGRSLPGRPETGKAGARWIARVAGMGMLRPGVVPPPGIRALRQYARQLLHLTQDRPGAGSGWTRCWRTPCAS